MVSDIRDNMITDKIGKFFLCAINVCNNNSGVNIQNIKRHSY